MNTVFESHKLIYVRAICDADGFPANLVPYIILGNVLFLLKSCVLRSFSGPLTEKQHIFSYGSQNVTNVFGTMIARWPIFLKSFKNNAENAVNTYLLAYHYLIVSARVMMPCTAQQGFLQLDNTTRWIRKGYWGSQINSCQGDMTQYREVAVSVRNAFVYHFNSLGSACFLVMRSCSCQQLSEKIIITKFRIFYSLSVFHKDNKWSNVKPVSQFKQY